MANNITRVRLLSVPLESDYKHTLYFSSPDAQNAYFLGKTVYNKDDFSYQRKEGFIRYPKHIDDLSSVNYIMYRNDETSTKWYYAFITDLEYKSEEVTFIHFELDVIQTYMFDYNIRPSFVEREHVDNDAKGAHTYPEGLEVGDFVCEYRDQVTELNSYAYVMGVTDSVVPVTEDADGWGAVTGGRYNGIYSGVKYYAYSDPSAINSMIAQYAKKGFSDSITSLFMYPLPLLELDESGNHEVLGSEKPKEINKNVAYNATFSTDYKPKNNKLYSYPYQYLLVTNNNGASAVYHFEDFASNKIEFLVQGCLTPGGSIRAIPKNYRGVAQNDEEGLNLGKFPICNWTSDEYTNWLTQNSVNIGVGIASGFGEALTGNVAGAINTIGGQLLQVHQMKFTSAQSRGNTNCGDVISASFKNTFFFQQMRIKEEYMIIIDNYFSMYGYKCNRVKVPFSNHRENYWYTKTIDVSIEPVTSKGIPMNDQQKIKECYNSGITFWRDPSKICDYSVSNEEIEE